MISIHAPPRGATIHLHTAGSGVHISIHAPPRGATCPATRRNALRALQFQFTPLREGRLTSDFANIERKIISIHAPPRGATIPLLMFRLGAAHFNSRPSARGDFLRKSRRRSGTISIHAPPRGATLIVCDDVVNLNISIHAPPRGATTTHTKNFRSPLISIHAPPRGATEVPYAARQTALISIHAPPRGATWCMACVGAIGISFQFTPLREGRHAASVTETEEAYFNSRPSARGDAGQCRVLLPDSYFNSRPSARGDLVAPRYMQLDFISIHAPPRGATTYRNYATQEVNLISIHAPPRGATWAKD